MICNSRYSYDPQSLCFCIKTYWDTSIQQMKYTVSYLTVDVSCMYAYNHVLDYICKRAILSIHQTWYGQRKKLFENSIVSWKLNWLMFHLISFYDILFGYPTSIMFSLSCSYNAQISSVRLHRTVLRFFLQIKSVSMPYLKALSTLKELYPYRH